MGDRCALYVSLGEPVVPQLTKAVDEWRCYAKRLLVAATPYISARRTFVSVFLPLSCYILAVLLSY